MRCRTCALTHDGACAILRLCFGYKTIRYTDQNGRCRIMERIKTLNTRNLCESAKNGGCGECQTSCQSACKTSCGVANQQCEKKTDK